MNLIGGLHYQVKVKVLDHKPDSIEAVECLARRYDEERHSELRGLGVKKKNDVFPEHRPTQLFEPATQSFYWVFELEKNRGDFSRRIRKKIELN